MKDLGGLQKTVWDQIRSATGSGDAKRLAQLAQIASEMDQMYEKWSVGLGGGTYPASSALPPHAPLAGSRNGSPANYTGRRLLAATFAGRPLRIANYKDLLLQMTETLSKMYPGDFDSAAKKVRGRDPYFSTNPKPRVSGGELRSPHRIADSNFWVETNLNANLIVEICERLALALGHGPGDLRLEIENQRTRRRKGDLSL